LGTQGTWAGGARANKQTSTIWPCFAILRPRKKKNLRFIDFAIFSGFRVLASLGSSEALFGGSSRPVQTF